MGPSSRHPCLPASLPLPPPSSRSAQGHAASAAHPRPHLRRLLLLSGGSTARRLRFHRPSLPPRGQRQSAAARTTRPTDGRDSSSTHNCWRPRQPSAASRASVSHSPSRPVQPPRRAACLSSDHIGTPHSSDPRQHDTTATTATPQHVKAPPRSLRNRSSGRRRVGLAGARADALSHSSRRTGDSCASRARAEGSGREVLGSCRGKSIGEEIAERGRGRSKQSTARGCCRGGSVIRAPPSGFKSVVGKRKRGRRGETTRRPELCWQCVNGERRRGRRGSQRCRRR